MKYILIASLLTSAVYAAPFAQVQGGSTTGQVTQGQPQQQQQQQGVQQGTQQQGVQNAGNNVPVQGPQTGGAVNGQTPTPADLATAVANWQADTSMVSNFLNTGKDITNNVQFKQAATVAFNAEVDELNHKAIIDAATGNDPNVVAANSTLATGGSFQDVVDKLQQMSVQGQAAIANIDLINQNRCVNVLPNIDAYFASTGSSAQAIRPTVCDQTGVAGGVQGAGPAQPGQPAGSPAAAFAAAQSLAAGTGNGLVQNGADAGNAVQNGQQQVQGGQQQVQGGQQAQAGQQQVQGGQQVQAGQQVQGTAPTQGGTQGQAPAQQAGTAPQQAQAPTAPDSAAQAQAPQQQADGNAPEQATSPATGAAATPKQPATGNARGGATQ